MVAHIIHSVRLINEQLVTDDAWVHFVANRVSETGVGDSWQALLKSEPNTTVTDGAGNWLSPGFIDLHVHGGGGASFDDGPAAILTAVALHRSHGTTRTLISLVTAPIANLAQQLRELRQLVANDPHILGTHLEGPFLNPEHKGAHDPHLLQTATPADIDLLLTAADGTLRQVTLAPELPGGIAALHTLHNAGVVVAVGHTATDYDGASAAFDAGASILTHAFNGMKSIHHRAPGPVLAAANNTSVTLEIINDGAHVHPAVVRMAFASAPKRIALITDAISAAGNGDGDYHLGGLAVEVRNGIARLQNGESIAGSTLTQDQALRQAVTQVGLDIVTAVQALTKTPAHAIGRSHDLGRLAPGYLADAVLLDEQLQVRQVWASGAAIKG